MSIGLIYIFFSCFLHSHIFPYSLSLTPGIISTVVARRRRTIIIIVQVPAWRFVFISLRRSRSPIIPMVGECSDGRFVDGITSDCERARPQRRRRWHPTGDAAAVVRENLHVDGSTCVPNRLFPSSARVEQTLHKSWRRDHIVIMLLLYIIRLPLCTCIIRTGVCIYIEQIQWKEKPTNTLTHTHSQYKHNIIMAWRKNVFRREVVYASRLPNMYGSGGNNL